MVPWQQIDSADVPGSENSMALYRRGDEFSIRVSGGELMNSRAHGSEEALAEMACSRIAGRSHPRVLIGGMGMGFTAAAALGRLDPEAQVVVAEIVPAVVRWNRGVLSHLAGHPLRDHRVTVREEDVAEILKPSNQTFDAIMLDVDNGPDGLTREANDWLYTREGLQAAHTALRPGGVLTVWSAYSAPAFSRLMERSGYTVETVRVRGRGSGKGGRHTVWVGQRGE